MVDGGGKGVVGANGPIDEQRGVGGVDLLVCEEDDVVVVGLEKE